MIFFLFETLRSITFPIRSLQTQRTISSRETEKAMASLLSRRVPNWPTGASGGAGSIGPERRQIAATPERRQQRQSRAPPLRRRRCRVEVSAFPNFFVILADVVAYSSSASTSFEPRLSPAIALSAALAALPPIIYWYRVAGSVKKRLDEEERVKKEEEAKERERLERLRRLKGEK